MVLKIDTFLVLSNATLLHLEKMTSLPFDVLRTILSSEEIPCSTKVELQKDLGPLPGKVTIPQSLKTKLDRVCESRQARTLLNGLSTEYCNIVSLDGKITMRIVMVNGTEHMSYVFKMRRTGGIVLTTIYDNVFGENNWYASRHT